MYLISKLGLDIFIQKLSILFVYQAYNKKQQAKK